MVQSYTTESERVKREEIYVDEVRPINLKWGAVIGGWLVALAVALLFYAIGAAIGVTAIDLTDAEGLNSKAAMTASIWMLVTWIVSLCLGGLFAGSTSRNLSNRSGVLHGIAVWALSSVLTLLLGVAGLGITGLTGLAIAGKAGKAITGGAVASASFVADKANDIAQSDLPENFQAQVKNQILKTVSARTQVDETTLRKAGEELNAQTVANIAGAFVRGDAEAAKNSLAVNTSLSEQEIDQIVASLEQQTAELKAKAKAAADKIAHYTSIALWAGILTSVMGLLAAIAGGKAGIHGEGVYEKHVGYETVVK